MFMFSRVRAGCRGHVRQDFSHPFGGRRQDNNGNSNVQMGHVPPTQTQATI